MPIGAVEKSEGLDSFGIEGGELEDDLNPHGPADEMPTRDLDIIHDFSQILSMVINTQPANMARCFRFEKPPIIPGNDHVSVGERMNKGLNGIESSPQSVGKEDRFFARSCVLKVKRDPVPGL